MRYVCQLIYAKKYLFNWQELSLDGKGIPEAILILTYALSLGYNSKIGFNAKDLHHRLNIEHIPFTLFFKRLLFNYPPHGIFSKYKCKEPQSYFYNREFMRYQYSVQDKVNYIFILANRRLDQPENFLPQRYIPENLWNNPFIERKNGNLYFKPEIKFHRRRIKFRKQEN